MDVPIIGQRTTPRDPKIVLYNEAGQPAVMLVSHIKKGDRVAIPQDDGTLAPALYAQQDAELVPVNGELMWGVKLGREQPDAQPAIPPTGDIKGQRQLSILEVALMNDIKDTGAAVQALIERLNAIPGLDPRMLAIGTTYCQLGLQQLVRAVARPTSFC